MYLSITQAYEGKNSAFKWKNKTTLGSAAPLGSGSRRQVAGHPEADATVAACRQPNNACLLSPLFPN